MNSRDRSSLLGLLDRGEVTCDNYEDFVGMGAYSTKSQGIGGVIKLVPEDFEVWEVLEGGLDARELFEAGPTIKLPPQRLALLVIRKRDRETMRVAMDLKSVLEVRLRSVKTYGLKDRRAVSWQFLAVPASKVLDHLYDEILLHNAAAKVVGEAYGIGSKCLLFNRFRIVIRETRTAANLEDLRYQLVEYGVPNYYGHQRFGVMRPVTHLVGYYILKENLEDAAKIFVGYWTRYEPEVYREVRRTFLESGSWSWAAANLSKSLVYERALAKHLASNPGDYVGAFRSLPLRIRRFLVEAYTSYVFNRALSLTLRDGYSLDDVMIGDLVVRLDRFGNPESSVHEVTVWNVNEAARRVREGSLAIVMPHPGSRVKFPRNERGRSMASVLEEDGMRQTTFRPELMPEAGTMGGYRPIKLIPRELTIKALDESTIETRMSLPRGSFATVVLRELMKQRCVLAYNGKLVH
ncbi:MAG: tRNA pseudouridine(13) synthase TruD [Thaumarchaeota archaeon]|nr:tRNA pseudouridine(13) synthase TruD [Candidatus Calditenuaceae archaeon]MDW8186969.1 tRNA pseudouridine(13) synthase TruD [Nitrososphaerota archaeon]